MSKSVDKFIDYLTLGVLTGSAIGSVTSVITTIIYQDKTYTIGEKSLNLLLSTVFGLIVGASCGATCGAVVGSVDHYYDLGLNLTGSLNNINVE